MPESENLGEPYVYKNDYPTDLPYSQADIDTRARRIYKYLDKLWGAGGDLLVDTLLRLAENDQNLLKRVLNEPPLRLKLDNDVVCAVIDLKTGRLASPPGAAADGKFYMLMLPAKPKGDPDDEDYATLKASQQWTEAFYHAVRQSGGM
jgi:hypothetical protein